MSAEGWELSEELRQIQDTVARFMAAEVKPAEDKAPHDAYELPADVLERLQAKARQIGLWCVRSPVEHGGAGLSLLGQAVVAEEAGQVPDGRLCACLWCLRRRSAERDLPRHAAADREVRFAGHRAGPQDLRCDQRVLRRRRPGALDPGARAAQGRSLPSQRQQDVDSPAPRAPTGASCSRAPASKAIAAASPASSSTASLQA
jgi:hypothetical protein